MDYYKLIEHLRRRGLGNGSALGPHSGLYDEAATAIETLRADLARVTAERDAAVADWRGFCVKCAWNGRQHLADGKMDDRCKTCRENGKCNWEWRSIQKEG